MDNDPPTIQIRATQRTDVGVVREHNEDNAFVDPQHQFFIVADGMGGHAAGEVASEMVVTSVRTQLESARDVLRNYSEAPSAQKRETLLKLLDEAVRKAHAQVFKRGSTEADKHGMGTTVDVVVVAGRDAFIAHVGDSRTYLVRDGEATQLTTDHTYVEMMVLEGQITKEEAANHRLKAVLVNAIGVSEDVGVELSHVELRSSDVVLLCSDGLHDYFPDASELASAVTTAPVLDSALEQLVDTAKNRGGHDNITGVLFKIGSVDGFASVDITGSEDTPLPEDIILPSSLEGVVEDDFFDSDGATLPGLLRRAPSKPLRPGKRPEQKLAVHVPNSTRTRTKKHKKRRRRK